jgi:hypothetical protein
MKTFIQCFLILFLSVFPIIVSAADLTAEQKKELTLFAMKAMGFNVGISDIKNVLTMPEIEKVVATGLNANGHLCAQITAILPLKKKSVYEATCIAYRGGSAKKSYIVDALKGVAFVP